MLFNPKGQIGLSERKLIITDACLMLIVVLPAIFLTLYFTWKYHHKNRKSKHSPDWKSNKKLEISLWIVPSLIIVILATLVWKDSHKLDPFKPIVTDNEPIVIQVVSLDWKWLFIYPKQGIATINQLVLPVNVPIHFFLTSETVMNGFFIPSLGSQILIMPNMQSELNLIANHEGIYDGISSNFSGIGFTGMKFKAMVYSEEKFYDWIKQVKHWPRRQQLNKEYYQQLSKPSKNNTIEYFTSLEPNLFQGIMQKGRLTDNLKNRMAPKVTQEQGKQ